MSLEYTIAGARPSDIPSLPAIELAAAKLLAGHAPESVLNETTGLDELLEAQRTGQLWVALADDLPVGFAHIEILEPLSAHLKEVDVHPQCGQRISKCHPHHLPRCSVERSVLRTTRLRSDPCRRTVLRLASDHAQRINPRTRSPRCDALGLQALIFAIVRQPLSWHSLSLLPVPVLDALTRILRSFSRALRSTPLPCRFPSIGPPLAPPHTVH
jgi:hypothetical protein